MYYSQYTSPFGTVTMASDGNTLTELRFTDATKGLSAPDIPVFAETVQWLDIYFRGGVPGFLPLLAPQGTPFQQKVWREMLSIPYGQTVSYGDIARRIGCRSAQAVGGAVGRNPIAVIIPCHRVVGSDGSLTGYAYGLDIKRRLLRLEQSSASPPVRL